MTFEKVAKILADYREMDVTEIKPETSFEEIGLDSLDLVDLVMLMEEEFGIEIEIQGNIKNVGDLVAQIESIKQ
jgi:acyl carrier protein